MGERKSVIIKGAGQVIAKGRQENAFFMSENLKNSHMLDNDSLNWTSNRVT